MSKNKIVILCIVSLPIAFGCSSAPVNERTFKKPEAEVQNGGTKQAKVYSQAIKNKKQYEGNAQAKAEFHFTMAQAYTQEGNPDRAIEEYKLALVFDPESPILFSRLATEYIKKGLLNEAAEACQEALRLDPKHVDGRLLFASLLNSTKDYKGALLQYAEVLKTDPTHEEAAVYHAQILSEMGQTELAIKDLQVFLKKTDESALVWYYLGRLLQKQERTFDAIKAYHQAIELRPSFVQASMSLGYLYEEKKQNEKAISIYKQLYEERQDLVAANRLVILLLKAEKYKDAIPYLEAIRLLDPEDLNAQVKLGLIYMESRNFEKAISIFNHLLLNNPESDRIHYYLGNIYEEMKNFKLAVDHLLKIKPESRLYSESVVHAGFLLKQQNQFEEAKNISRRALASSPKSSALYLFLASLEEETGNITGAIETLEKGIQYFLEDEKMRYYLGSLYDRQGDTTKGLEQMEEILRVNPNNVDALNYVGYTLTLQGVRLNEAEQLLKKALALKPDNGFIQDSWGWYLFVIGKTREAVVELEKAIALRPEEPTILDHLGDAYMKLNLTEKAYAKYMEALQKTKDEELRKKLVSKVNLLKEQFAKSGKNSPIIAEEGASLNSGARTPAHSYPNQN